jgi:hypothetical protein
MRLKILAVLFIAVIGIIVFSLYVYPARDIKITDATTAKGVDEKLKPVGITNVFPAGTASVSCWFQWANALPNTSIMASWYFVSDDIRILDYTFDIPRKNGSGSVSLSMPQGKELPAGTYRVELKRDKRSLRSLTFRVLEKQ